jgi:L-lysine exporter family protein LysE/ArgO
MDIYLQGLTMGLAYVAPIGVQNLFVINGALTRRRREALLRAWIVIFFDITLSMACFFGIGVLMERYTWFNPHAIIDGTMMLGAFRAVLPAGASLSFLSGVVSASCLWFTFLTLFVSIFRERFHVRILRMINIICGLVVIGYGCRLLLHFMELL